MKGFSLVEVLVSMALLSVTAAGLAAMSEIAVADTRDSRTVSAETFAAASKMAELRARTFTFGADGSPVTDPVLAASPAGALSVNTPGFVDFINASGVVTGAAAEVPPAALYIRRWSVAPAPQDPANTLVLQVVATRVTRPAARDVHLVSIVSRTRR